MKSLLYLFTLVAISFSASAIEAQTPTPDAGNIDRARPIRQQSTFSNPNSGSRQFFDGGKDKLYFLEESEPILQIESESDRELENSDREIEEKKDTDLEQSE